MVGIAAEQQAPDKCKPFLMQIAWKDASAYNDVNMTAGRAVHHSQVAAYSKFDLMIMHSMSRGERSGADSWHTKQDSNGSDTCAPTRLGLGIYIVQFGLVSMRCRLLPSDDATYWLDMDGPVLSGKLSSRGSRLQVAKMITA